MKVLKIVAEINGGQVVLTLDEIKKLYNTVSRLDTEASAPEKAPGRKLGRPKLTRVISQEQHQVRRDCLDYLPIRWPSLKHQERLRALAAAVSLSYCTIANAMSVNPRMSETTHEAIRGWLEHEQNLKAAAVDINRASV